MFKGIYGWRIAMGVLLLTMLMLFVVVAILGDVCGSQIYEYFWEQEIMNGTDLKNKLFYFFCYAPVAAAFRQESLLWLLVPIGELLLVWAIGEAVNLLIQKIRK